MEETEVVGSKERENASEELKAGKVFFERFKLIEKLGEGGMGIVFKAEDQFLSTLVALKFFPKSNLSDKKLKRIKREVLKGRELTHKNILKYYEVYEDKNYLVISMEYIKGKTLSEELTKKEFDEKEIKKFLLQMLEALKYIHSKGIIHRDIKPSNIFIKEDASLVTLGLFI